MDWLINIVEAFKASWYFSNLFKSAVICVIIYLVFVVTVLIFGKKE